MPSGASSKLFLNTCRDDDSTTSLASVLQLFTALSIKKKKIPIILSKPPVVRYYCDEWQGCCKESETKDMTQSLLIDHQIEEHSYGLIGKAALMSLQFHT